MQQMILSELAQHKAPTLYKNEVMAFRERLSSESYPKRKEEQWKYANLSFLDECDSVAKSNQSHVMDFDEVANTVTLTLRDLYTENLSIDSKLPGGIELKFVGEKDLIEQDQLKATLSNSWKYKNYFSNLNYASAAKNLVLCLSEKWSADIVIKIKFEVTGGQGNFSAWQTHLSVVCKPGANVKIIESYDLKENYFLNTGVDYYIGENSHLEVLKLESGDGRGCHTGRFTINKSASADLTTLTENCEWSRHNIYSELVEPGAEMNLRAAYLATGKQFVDHHTIVEHQVEHTTSSQNYNGILSGQSEAVFNGQVNILRYAQKSSSAQLNRNLLLSKAANINTKPELQIDADDVKASHGATVGQISEDELFYLQSRGIGENQARTILSRGFALEVGNNLSPKLKNVFTCQVESALSKVFEEHNVL